MTHLPFVAGSYGLAAGVTLWLVLDAWLRLGRARRRLRATDPREAPALHGTAGETLGDTLGGTAH